VTSRARLLDEIDTTADGPTKMEASEDGARKKLSVPTQRLGSCPISPTT
jgi:hypothetical protein